MAKVSILKYILKEHFYFSFLPSCFVVVVVGLFSLSNSVLCGENLLCVVKSQSRAPHEQQIECDFSSIFLWLSSLPAQGAGKRLLEHIEISGICSEAPLHCCLGVELRVLERCSPSVCHVGMSSASVVCLSGLKGLLISRVCRFS